MITASIKLHGRHEKRTEILQTLRSLRDELSREKKCGQVNVYQNVDDEDIFFLVEDWPNEEELDEYLSSRLFKILLGVKPILQDPLEIKLLTEVKKIVPEK